MAVAEGGAVARANRKPRRIGGLAFFLFPAIGFTWHAKTIAHIAGVSVPAITSYFGHRHFSFASKNDPTDVSLMEGADA